MYSTEILTNNLSDADRIVTHGTFLRENILVGVRETGTTFWFLPESVV